MSSKKRVTAGKTAKTAKARKAAKTAKTKPRAGVARRTAKKTAKRVAPKAKRVAAKQAKRVTAKQAKRVTAKQAKHPAAKLKHVAKAAKRPVAKVKRAAAKAERPAAAKRTTPSAKRAKPEAHPEIKRRDGSGHLDPQYAADLREMSRAEPHDEDRAFLAGPRSGDSLSEELGEEYVTSVTSGEDDVSETRDQRVAEDVGGPFVITTGGTEYAGGTDESNPEEATREPFPKT